MSKIRIFTVRINETYREEDIALVNDFLESVKLVQIVPTIVHAPPEIYWSVFIAYDELEEKDIAPYEKILLDSSEALTPEEDEMFFRLRTWRNNQSLRENLPVYMILHDSHLKTIIKMRPQSKQDFFKISGIGRRKIEKYWKEILQTLLEGKK
jgi:superfamily II DNA helicase RecQ